MNDRFKFRTYIPDLKFFKFWGWIEDNHYVGLCACGDYQMPELLEKYTNQCTGLKDKNGKLIYEGDIVKFYFDRDKVIGVIAWDNEHQVGFYVNTTDYFKDKYITNYDFLCGFNYEVIGNIYENKELLNDK